MRCVFFLLWWVTAFHIDSLVFRALSLGYSLSIICYTDTLLQHWKSPVSWSASNNLFPRGWFIVGLHGRYQIMLQHLMQSLIVIIIVSGSCIMWPSIHLGQKRNTGSIQVLEIFMQSAWLILRWTAIKIHLEIMWLV